MAVNGGSIGKGVFHAELVPLAMCAHSCALEVPGIEHFLPGLLLPLLRRTVSIPLGDGGSHFDQLRGGGLADLAVHVGVIIPEHLQQPIVELSGGLFHEPDEVFPGTC